MTFIEGVSFDALDSSEQARAAGQLFGQFHRALEDLEHTFVGVRLGVHDTAKHLASLRDAVAECGAHPLHAKVAPIASEIDAAQAALPPLPELALIVGHGDPKISNVLFDSADTDRALCLIDLDTLGPVHLGHELGDAWRSWCNRLPEDAPPSFDLALFEASLDGYRQARQRSLTGPERRALLLGVEWIALELAARFAADALRERYFGWDEARYRTRGEHNLARATSQLALHHAVVSTRPTRARLIG
jgi:Ser/Thr protein kinase RdoA (MazF antagonist)